MIKRWLFLLLILIGSGWFTWQLFMTAEPADITLLAFVFGPALILFTLGVVFGGLWLRPTRSKRRSVEPKPRTQRVYPD